MPSRKSSCTRRCLRGTDLVDRMADGSEIEKDTEAGKKRTGTIHAVRDKPQNLRVSRATPRPRATLCRGVLRVLSEGEPKPFTEAVDGWSWPSRSSRQATPRRAWLSTVSGRCAPGAASSPRRATVCSAPRKPPALLDGRRSVHGKRLVDETADPRIALLHLPPVLRRVGAKGDRGKPPGE